MRLSIYEDLSLQITHPTQESLATPPLLILDRGVGSSTSHKNQISQSAVREKPFLVRKALSPNSNWKCFFITCRAKMWKVDSLRHQWKHSSQSISLSLSLLLVVWPESCWQQSLFTWWWEGMTASSFWRAKSTRKLRKPWQWKRKKKPNWL